MKVADFLSAFTLLVLASSFLAIAFAYDPSPLQDVCVAIDDSDHSTVQVNGKFCKNPDEVTSDDFYFSGLNTPRDTSNQLGVNVTLLTVDSIPGLNTLGVSLARIDYAPDGGLNPPHAHPRASEILWCLEGTLYAGFVTSNPDHRLYTKVLQPGDVFVFPFGLIHFQLNVGKTRAVAVAALTSQNPGVDTIANAVFGSEPAIDPRVLSKAFHLSESQVEELQGETWQNPS